jgi:hypothetical protein
LLREWYGNCDEHENGTGDYVLHVSNPTGNPGINRSESILDVLNWIVTNSECCRFQSKDEEY